MATIRVMQSTFNGGEVSPDMWARTTFEKYESSLKTMENFYPRFCGGATNRAGTEFIAEVKDSAKKVKLMPFQFSVEQAYIIEAGEDYFRYYKDGGQIINTSANVDVWVTATAYVVDNAIINDAVIYRCISAHTSSATDEPGTGANWATYWVQSDVVETTTTYAEDDLFNLKTAQSADNMYICNNLYNPKTLTRSSHYDWELDDFTNENGPFRAQNVTDITVTPSAIAGNGITLTASSAIFDNKHIGSLMQISHDVTGQVLNLAYTATTTSASIRCYGNWSLITHGTWKGKVELQRSVDEGSTWATIRSYTSYEDTNIETSGETDELTLLRILYTHTSGTCRIDLNAYSFVNNGVVLITGVTSGTVAIANVLEPISGSSLVAGLRNYTLTTNFAGGDAITILGVTFYAGGGQSGVYFKTNATLAEAMANLAISINTVSAITSLYHTTLNGSTLTLTENNPGGGHTPTASTVVGTGVVNSTSYVKSGSSVNGTKDWAFGAWNDLYGYPSCVKFFQNRLVFAGTTKDPLTVWLSAIGDYPNFIVNYPIKDDDAITAPLVSSQVNAIRSMVSMGYMLCFTAGGLFRVGTGSESVALTPSSIRGNQQAYTGSAELQPLAIGNSILSLNEMGNTVNDYGYNAVSDMYQGNNLTVLVSHLFEHHTIVDWAYAQSPDNIIWCVRDDGLLLSFTYLPEQKVWAWARHTTDGYFESVATIPGDNYTEVWFVVRRKINGTWKRYIERMTDRNISSDVQDQHFVDCGLIYNNPLTITNITKANPAIVTSASHGLSAGDIVDLSDIVGMTELNGNRYKVGTVATDTFQLLNMDDDTNVNSTAFTTYESGGYARKCILTVSGLDHLEGKTVTILANGSVASPKIVSSGSIALDEYASRLHIGLGYDCEIETLNFDYPLQDGVAQGRKRRIPKLTLRLEKTKGGSVAINEGNYTLIKYSPSSVMGKPYDLFTGDKEVVPFTKFDTEARVHIKQTDPLPISVLAIMPEVELGD